MTFVEKPALKKAPAQRKKVVPKTFWRTRFLDPDSEDEKEGEAEGKEKYDRAIDPHPVSVPKKEFERTAIDFDNPTQKARIFENIDMSAGVTYIDKHDVKMGPDVSEMNKATRSEYFDFVG